MLPWEHRLVRSNEFAETVRHGRRAGDGTLVVHVARADSTAPARVGFVVSRAVGGSVVRNRVKRRLRHIVRDDLARLENGGLVVVRALPRAAQATTAELAASFDRCLSRCARSGVEAS